MAENTSAENRKQDEASKTGKSGDELVDFSGMDGDDIVALSDDELDNILNTAEISETPIADIDIDLEMDEAVAVDEVAASDSPPPPAEPESGGFFEEGEEETTISISTGDLDTILDDASAEPSPAAPRINPEAPILGGDEEMVVGPPAEQDTAQDALSVELEEQAAVAAEPSATVSAESEGFEGFEDDDILMLEDEELVIDEGPEVSEEEGLAGAVPVPEQEEIVIEEVAPVLVEEGGEEIILEETIPAPEPEEISLEIEIDEEPALPETAQAAAPQEGDGEEDTPIIALSGEELDAVVGVSSVASEGEADGSVAETAADATAEMQASPEEPLEEFILEEDLSPVSGSTEDDGVITLEESGIDLDFEELPEEPVAEEEAAPAAEVVPEEPVAAAPAAEVVHEEPVAAAPAPTLPDFQREAEASLEQEEVLIIGEDEISFEDAVEIQEPVAVEEPAAVEFEEIPVAEEADSGTIPVVPESAVRDAEEPMEIIDDELIYTEEEKIPVDGSPAEDPLPVKQEELPSGDFQAEEVVPEPELISDEDITEMGVPEQVTAGATPAGVPEGESVQGLPEETKTNMKKMLGYLDDLFDDLPEAKVKEFANSEYYDLYNKLFKELGI